jgi:glyoxylate reductase
MFSMRKPHVLVTVESEGQVSGKALRRLQEIANVDVVKSSIFSHKNELMQIIGDYEGAIITSNIPFDREVIAKAEKLKVVSRLGVGYDRVDVKAAVERGVYVTNTPVLSETVVELVFGLLFAAARNISKADAYVKGGKWTVREERVKFTGVDFFGKTLGIVGLGRLGSLLARRARSFDMTLLYTDIVRYRDLEEELDVQFLPLDSLLPQADFISLHTPLSEKTRGLIGEKEFKNMKPSAILINTSRGPVVDEAALVRALTEGWIAYAGLDVYENEPMDVYENEPIRPDSPLLTLDNVVLTPHLGAGTRECNERVVSAAVENTIRVLKGEKPLYPVTS